jgi:hypothetical protein
MEVCCDWPTFFAWQGRLIPRAKGAQSDLQETVTLGCPKMSTPEPTTRPLGSPFNTYPISRQLCATISGHSKVSNKPIHMMVPPYYNIKEIVHVRMGNAHAGLLLFM